MTKNEQKSQPPVPHKLRKAIKSNYNNICQRCNQRFDSNLLHIHHIRPRWAGGNNDPDNLLPICLNCHGIIHQSKEGDSNVYSQSGTLLYRIEDLHLFIQVALYTGYKEERIKVLYYSNFEIFTPDPDTRYSVITLKNRLNLRVKGIQLSNIILAHIITT